MNRDEPEPAKGIGSRSLAALRDDNENHGVKNDQSSQPSGCGKDWATLKDKDNGNGKGNGAT